MSIKAISADKSSSLDDLSLIIWGNEIVWGQCSRIGNDGEATVILLDREHIPIATDDVLHARVVAGVATPPGALALLCSGKAFVGGVVTEVSVYRV
ncbi:hypothetical protein [Sphingomonas sp.]|jgi:hypothetical protein|uniref:hypothetical protein n=1 Tax=Sphingomonas sp. TaxID=28214 RepID=UPI0025F21288|nr:hypothetical protein [Sphingomonas sp.]